MRMQVGILGFILLFSLTFFTLPVQAADKGEIKALVQEVLSENPQLIIQALEKYREEQQQALVKKQRGIIGEIHKRIEKTEKNLEYGNPQGDVTIVEFFDYQCGYCKRAFEDLIQAVDKDGNVRLIFLEFPILGPGSKTGSEGALAAHKQGKYFAYHRALMEHKGRVSEGVVLKIAKDLGLDLDQFKQDMASEATQKELEANLQLATDLSITGTPAFIIGDAIVPGAIDTETFTQLINEARKPKERT